MHYYSKSFRHSWIIYVVLAGVAGVVSYIINSFLSHLDWRVVGSISFFSVFALLDYLFEFHLWRILLMVPVFRLKDFTGNWAGELKVGDEESSYLATLKITQTWSRILVEFDSAGAEGRSFSASIFFDRFGNRQLELAYIYYARDKNNRQKNYFDHYGTAILYLTDNGSKLKGDYFTERSRHTFGKMEFTQE